ncbi:MAG: class IV adenylate cyclase [Anaerolineales bacterium]|nr:class IV adenylate cyclase [Anaerolineales bacterium]MCZ2121234.1 class IV adenylate cyclase [Anaerolineales bacterium]
MNGQEIESKFYVSNLKKIKAKLTGLGAILIQPRVHEANLRFDTPKQDLRKTGRVLRLRQDETAKMTYKGASKAVKGVAHRKEIEFEIANFAAGKELIEALGYELILFYEKYRTTYELNKTQIMLDELPYGNFVEIEGRNIKSIQKTAGILGLDFSKAVTASYPALFERVAKGMRIDTRALSFKAFKSKKPNAEKLGVEKAD